MLRDKLRAFQFPSLITFKCSCKIFNSPSRMFDTLKSVNLYILINSIKVYKIFKEMKTKYLRRYKYLKSETQIGKLKLTSHKNDVFFKFCLKICFYFTI